MDLLFRAEWSAPPRRGRRGPVAHLHIDDARSVCSRNASPEGGAGYDPETFLIAGTETYRRPCAMCSEIYGGWKQARVREDDLGPVSGFSGRETDDVLSTLLALGEERVGFLVVRALGTHLGTATFLVDGGYSTPGAQTSRILYPLTRTSQSIEFLVR